MTPQTQYRDYNKVKVTLITNAGNYILSNVNKRGLPNYPDEQNGGAHLQSIEITSPTVGTNNPQDMGTTGTVSIVDYQDAVFNILSNHLKAYADKVDSTPKKEYLPKISIEISCFTNSKSYKEAHITDWSMQFSGGTPTLTLNWTTLCPSDEPKEPDALPKDATYNSPKALIDAVKNAYKEDIPFVDESGKDMTGEIKFINNSVVFDLSKLKSCENKLIDTYNFILSNCTSNDGKILACKDASSDKYLVFIKNPKENAQKTEEGDICKHLLFVQNGKYKAYEQVQLKDGSQRYVIPMTSFSFNTNMKNLILQSRLLANPNGNVSSTSNGNKITSGSAESNEASQESTASNTGNDAISISFECCNVMAFNLNNDSSKIKYDIYNERGQKHQLSGEGIVRSCKYTISGAVVRASVECTEVFNSCDGKSSPAPATSDPPTEAEQEAAQEAAQEVTDYKKYLCSEDSRKTQLSRDNTRNAYTDDVKEFITKYGDLTGSSRLLDKNFVQQLIKNNDFGLLTLLISVANYGIKDPDPKWKIDAVNLDPGFKNKKPFCASGIGKGPYDYKKGGLGIAHWDSGNLDDIYTTVGFPPDMPKSDQDHFSKLLVTSGTVTWGLGSFYKMPRLIPKFSKGAKMRLFDKGLKQDSKWLKWAHDILYYRTPSGEMPYQYFLFELWFKKFWYPTIDGLKSKSPSGGHTPCLQDAARIARAGNSATGLISKSCGKNVEKQYELYYNDKERYMRQKAFCRRCADIIGYET